jgi:hypothetical protein
LKMPPWSLRSRATASLAPCAKRRSRRLTCWPNLASTVPGREDHWREKRRLRARPRLVVESVPVRPPDVGESVRGLAPPIEAYPGRSGKTFPLQPGRARSGRGHDPAPRRMGQVRRRGTPGLVSKKRVAGLCPQAASASSAAGGCALVRAGVDVRPTELPDEPTSAAAKESNA